MPCGSTKTFLIDVLSKQGMLPTSVWKHLEAGQPLPVITRSQLGVGCLPNLSCIYYYNKLMRPTPTATYLVTAKRAREDDHLFCLTFVDFETQKAAK